MKVSKTLLVGMAAAALALSGCISAPFVPPTGAICTIKAPLSTEGNWRMGKKSGSASCTDILGVFAEGDCSITAAAAAGGLKTVYYADYEYHNVLGIWQQATVTVYGE